MASISDLFVTLGLDAGGYISGLRDAQREGREFQKQLSPISNLLKDTGQAMTSVGAGLTAAFTVPLLAAGASAIKFGGDFDEAMTQSIAIMGDVSSVMRTDLEDAAKQMAQTTVFSAKEGADALFFLSSSGLNAADSINALPVVAKFAQAGVFSLAQATEFLTDAQSALGLKTGDAVKDMENMVRVSDVLVKANILSNATTQQFAEALTNRAGAALRLVNKDVEEGVAVLAAFASQGVKGQVAGEQLAIVMRDLQSKAISNKAEFAQLGVSVFDSSGKMLNMADIIASLEAVLGGMSDEQKKATLHMLGFTDRSLGAMLQLIGTSDAIRTYEQQLRSAGGTTDEIANKQMESFKNQMALVQHQVELLGISLFQAIAPTLKDVVIPALSSAIGVVQEFATWFKALPVPVQAAGLALAALTASIGPLLVGAGFVATQIGGLVPVFARLTPILLGEAGVSGALTAISTAFTYLQSTSVLGGISTLMAGVQGAFVSLSASIAGLSGASVLGALSSGLASAQAALVAFAASTGGTLLVLGTLAVAVYKLVDAWLEYRNAQTGLQEAENRRENAVRVAIASLKAHGIAIDTTGKSLQQLEQEVAAAGQSMVQSKKETDAWFNSLQPQAQSNAKTMTEFRAEVFGVHDAAKHGAAGVSLLTDEQKKAASAAADHRDKLAQLSNFLTGAENNFTQPIKGLNAQYVLLNTNVDIVTPKIQAMTGPVISDMEMLGLAMKSNSAFTLKAATDEAALFAARQKDLEAYQAKVNQATEDVKQSAGKIFDDMFIKGENVFSSLKSLLEGGALSLGRAIFSDIVGQLLGPVKLAFDDFLKGLIEGPISGFAKSIGSKLGGTLGSVLGIGGNTATAVAGTAGSAATGAVSAAGGVGSTAASIGGGATSLTGSLISGGLAAAGGIIGGLLTKGNSQRTEENTREARDWLELQTTTWNPLFFAMEIHLGRISDNTTNLGNIIYDAAEGLRSSMFDVSWAVATAIIETIKNVAMGQVAPAVIDSILPGPSAAANSGPAPSTIYLTYQDDSQFTVEINGAMDIEEIADQIDDIYDRNQGQKTRKLAEYLKRINPSILTVPA